MKLGKINLFCYFHIMLLSVVLVFVNLSAGKADSIPSIEEFYNGDGEVHEIKLRYTKDKSTEEAYWIIKGSLAKLTVLMIEKDDLCYDNFAAHDGVGRFKFQCRSGAEIKASFQCQSILCTIRAKHSTRGSVVLSIKNKVEMSQQELMAFSALSGDGGEKTLAIASNDKPASQPDQNLSSQNITAGNVGQNINMSDMPQFILSNSRTQDAEGVFEGRITHLERVSEVLVDGQNVPVKADGSLVFSSYVPLTGKDLQIKVIDISGQSSLSVVRLQRTTTASASVSFDQLNPIKKKARKNPDAIALIVGLERYERTTAQAIYADSDAATFHDYAALKLGVPEDRITTLLNEKAQTADVLLSVKSWLARSVKPGQSDVYIFFAGHGLGSEDGEQMYLLTYDGAPELLEDTAISRERIFADISSANPRSVTVFLDACYSGSTRGTETLIASRPIFVRIKKQEIPNGFTVFNAAGGTQTAKPLEEAKHGMFSYFLMKGMEGDADSNGDNQITAAELHGYVEQNVIQQSGGSQTPELQGDANRVLVRFE